MKICSFGGNMKFSERLKAARKEAGLSQGALAEKAGISMRTLQNYEMGKRYPASLDIAVNLATALSMTAEELLSEVSEKSRLVFDTLTGATGVLSVSGLGLMIGIETVRPAKEIVAACMARGVLCLTAKNKVRLLPALNIPRDILAEALAVIKEECAREVNA
jgi:transcriptional regulator with XRE-family HTH domain